MQAFRAFLVLVLVALVGYTIPVLLEHGVNLFAVFFGDIAQLAWPGQFNLDFLCMLLLSGLWVSWRHQFSAAGIGLGLLAVLGGALFLSVYLLVQSVQVKGDAVALVVGEERARR